MGCLKSVSSFFKTPSMEEIEERSKITAEENDKALAKTYKEKEGLDYKKMICVKNAWGVEETCGDIFSILIFSDRIRFVGKFDKRDLFLKDIINLEVLTDTQIEEKSKLGQMMLIGVFALGTKSKTQEVTKRKLVINASECGINFSVIVETIRDTLMEAKLLGKGLEEYKNNT